MRHRKNRTMKGGFWNNFTGLFNKKPAATTAPSSTSSYTPSSTPSYTPSSTTSSTPSYTPSYTPSSTPSYSSSLTGGRRKRKTIRMRRRRTMKGGYSASRSLNDLASTASSFSGNKTAQPQVWLGGKSRKRRRCKR